MKEKTAMFSGHRNIPGKCINKIETLAKEIIVSLINKGVIYYGNGGARGFDLLAAKCVLDLKLIYPQIKLIMVLPCIEQTTGWEINDIVDYRNVLNNSDKIVYVNEKYSKRCMLDRNDHLVNNSAYCIAYLTNNKSGTAYTVNRAKSQGLEIYNIAHCIFRE